MHNKTMDFRDPRMYEAETGKLQAGRLLNIPGANSRRQSVDVSHNFAIPRQSLGAKVLIQSIDSPDDSPRIN